jgi:hypothetical protein
LNPETNLEKKKKKRSTIIFVKAILKIKGFDDFFCVYLFFYQVIIEKEELRNEEKVLTEEVTAKTSELQHLEEELELLKAAAEMAFGDQNSIDFCFEQLKGQVDAKRCNITELKSQW